MTVKFNPYTRIIQSGSNMVFFDQSNPAGWTLTQLAQSGSGGTSSGSIGANLFASYLLINPDAENVNARTVAAGPGVTFTDGGPGGTFTISATGSSGSATVDPNAPFILTKVTGSVPAGRALVVNGPLTLTDGGPGGQLVLGLTPISSQSANAYDGYCTGSLTWTATSWTDFSTVPGNFVDTIQNGITRSGSTFTVSATGYYGFHSSFVYQASSRYIGFRLSGSNGTLLQQVGWEGTDNGVAVPRLHGTVFLTSGSSVRLQYATKGGTTATWAPSDPLDGENMRTGNVTMFRIADPLTITNVPTTAPFGWQTALDLDFTVQTPQTFTTDGQYTINGLTWTKDNSANETVASSIGPNGLKFIPASTTDLNAATYTAPTLSVPLSSIIPNYALDTPIRVWLYIGGINAAINYDGTDLALGNVTPAIVSGSTYIRAVKGVGNVGSTVVNYYALNLNGSRSSFEATADYIGNNVQVILVPDGMGGAVSQLMTGLFVSGSSWPLESTLQPAANATVAGGVTDITSVGNANAQRLVLGAHRAGSATNLVVTYNRIKVEYLQQNAGAILNSNAFISSTYVAPDQNDYLWWPLNETQGPYAFNYGTAGAIGNMTASSGNVHFNQVGPLRTAIGTNTAGQTGNYLGILNTATQPTPSASVITVSAWFRPEGSTSTNHQKILCKSYFNSTATWNSPFVTIDLGLAGTGDGKMEYSLNGLSVAGPTTVSSASCCTPNEWNHAGISYDGAFVRCYLNGVLVYQFASTGNIDYSGNGWWAIGGNQSIPATEYFQGQIADVRVANVARSSAWFNQVWLAGRPDANPALSIAQYVTSSGGSSNITSGSLSGPNAWVEGGVSPLGGTQIRTTSSVAISDGTENFYAGMKGRDVFFYVSGTVGAQEPVANASPFKSVFGGDTVMSGSLSVQGSGGITGSITRMPTGNPYIIGIGGTGITTNSLGQIVVSSSIGGSGGGTAGINVENQGAVLPASPYQTINFIGPGVTTSDVGGVATVNITAGTQGVVPGGFAAYYGFCTGSLLWSATGTWTNAFNVPGNFTDVQQTNIQRNGSVFTVLQTGLYNFRSYFNAMAGANGTYIAFRLSGSNGPIISRTTFATDNQQPSILEGLFQLNSGSSFTLQYLTSGSAEQLWSPSDPTGTGADTQNMRTGEVSIFLIPSGSATVNNYSITASVGNTAYSPANYAMATASNSFPFDTTVAGYQNVPNTQVTITTTGNPVLIMANAAWNAQTAGAQAYFSLARDGTNLAPIGGLQGAGPTSLSYNNNASFAYVDFGATAGTHTYQLLAEAVIGAGELGAWGVGPTALMVFEMKGANVVTASTTLSQAVPGGNLTGLTANIIPKKGPVLVIGSSNMSSDAGGSWGWMDVWRNGSSLANGASQGLSVNVGSNTNEIQGNCFMVLDQGATVGATNTYAMRATNGGGTNHVNFGSQVSSLILWELSDVNYKYSFSTSQITPATLPSYTDIDPQSPTAGLVTRGRPVLLISTINSNTSGNGRNGYTFFRNGSNVTTGSKGLQIADGEGNSDWNKMPTLFWIDQTPVNNAGFYQYQVMGTVISASAFTAQGSYTYLFMYELDPGGPGVVIDGWFDEGNFLFTTSSIQALGNATFGNTTMNQFQATGLGTNVISGSLLILGQLTFASGSGMAITGSSVSRQYNIPFLDAMVTSPQYSGSKANLGVHKYDPTKFNTGIDTLSYKYRAIFAPVLGNGNAFVDLYDYSGIINGTPGPVSGSVLTASLPSTLTIQEVDITRALQNVTGSGIFLARAWVDPSGSNFVNVGGVELSLEWH